MLTPSLAFHTRCTMRHSGTGPQSNRTDQSQFRMRSSEQHCAESASGELMKKFVLGFIVMLLCSALPAQEAHQPLQGRLFLPSDTFWGFAQFDIAPPHNEIDPNLCIATAGNYGGKSAPCNAFARYMLS